MIRPGLIQLDLSANRLTSQEVNDLALQSDLTSAVLNKLVLSRNKKIKDEGASALGKALKTNKSLKELELEECNIGPNGGKALAAALSEGAAVLTYLNLSRNRLCGVWKEWDDDDEEETVQKGTYDPSGIKALADALSVNAVLKSINLRGNNLGTEGWCAIFHALRDNKVKDNKIESWDLLHQGGCIGAMVV